VFKKILLSTVLLTLVVLFFINGGQDYLSYETFNEHKVVWLDYAESNFWQAIFLASGVYILATALSVPGASILTLTIGFIFGRWLGVALVLVSATIGATVLFILARYLVADWARKHIDKIPAAQNMLGKFDADVFNYLLFMRLMPVFPFWLVNLTFAFTPISIRHYVIGTFVGMIPACFILVNLGQSLATVDEIGQLFSFEVILALVLFALLALVPVIIKHFKSKTDTVKTS